ncbi:HipA family kinase [Leptolyngbya sp. PCC 6406]|uniref:HipA family kinase n=1 Tax=Leptolyngbya sp. PCC 6406 TaxID=1173264 RepID=UPI00047FE8F1|nr:HipA family kinase [Leptolyngbya sp. PCC 6406]
MLQNASPTQDPPLQARTYLRAWRTKAQPVLLNCADGGQYMVKGRQAGRQIINDQVVARLGTLLGAPVGEPKLIDVPSALIEIEPNLSHLQPGIAHGTRFIPDCMDQPELIATSQPENRSRLARLAVLYAWVVPGDWQFLFSKSPPRLVYSVDHGHFFPGGPEWTVRDLQQAAPPYLPSCFSVCALTPEDWVEALLALSQIPEEEIVHTVAAIPEEWGLTIEERVVLVQYLLYRRSELPSTLQAEE